MRKSPEAASQPVMSSALALDVDIVNDVWALRQPGALQALAASSSAGVCLMHMRGEPGTMQTQTSYVDVVAAVGAFLHQRMYDALAAGVAFDRIPHQEADWSAGFRGKRTVSKPIDHDRPDQ